MSSQQNHTEYEKRYVLSAEAFLEFRNALQDAQPGAREGYAVRELTVMYENPNPSLSFYAADVDGRLRLRTAQSIDPEILRHPSMRDVAVLTWKQRIPEHAKSDMRIEREIELEIPTAGVSALRSILEDVLHCPRVASYERNRETVYWDGIEIAIDTFPYGHVVELELKEGDESDLERVASALSLSSARVSHLSCDDLYDLLCDKAGVAPRSDILFNDPEMPSIDKHLDATCQLTL